MPPIQSGFLPWCGPRTENFPSRLDLCASGGSRAGFSKGERCQIQTPGPCKRYGACFEYSNLLVLDIPDMVFSKRFLGGGGVFFVRMVVSSHTKNQTLHFHDQMLPAGSLVVSQFQVSVGRQIVYPVVILVSRYQDSGPLMPVVAAMSHWDL